MRLGSWFALSAAITFLFGLASILVPALVGSMFGNSTDASSALWANYYGSAVLFIALITWFVRGSGDFRLQRMTALLLCFFYAVNLVISVRAQVGGAVNYFGWTNIVTEAVMVLAFGYFVWVARSEPESEPAESEVSAVASSKR